MKNMIFYLFWATIILFAGINDAEATGLSSSGSVEGVYKTTYRNMSIIANGNYVSGTYESGNGKLQGTLSGNKLSGTWNNSSSGKKGRFEFVFATDFSSFTGKFGYNEAVPNRAWNGTKISSPPSSVNSSETQPSATEQQSDPQVSQSYSSYSNIEGKYTTDFRELTLTLNGNSVSGTYESGNGKLKGTLSGNTLRGTWTNSGSNKSGNFEFVFTSDFSSFTGKYAYNNNTPSSRWNGKRIGSSGSATTSDSKQIEQPINVIGCWTSGGKRTGRGGLNIWQNGNHFEIIIAWIDEENDLWKSYKGEGEFEGREMNFKVFPSNVEGKSVDQGYVYHYKISPDNNEITGYYTRYGKKTSEIRFHYNRIK